MTDPVDTLLLDVRANTQGFADDVAAMRGTFDGTLVDGFSKAGRPWNAACLARSGAAASALKTSSALP